MCASTTAFFKTTQRDWKNECVSAFVSVCLSSCDHSSTSECPRVCMLSCVTVCVLFGVCTGVYLYKDVGGVLDLGSQFKH